MDKLVFDIETKNSFREVGGERNIAALQVSVVGVYSYNQDKYWCFTEHELDKVEELFKGAGLVIGHTINRFDLPVLQKHFSFNTKALAALDICEDVELAVGRKIGLDDLGKVNLGMSKTHHSLEAIELYRDGNMEELKNYCLNDVKITKELYDLGKKQGFLKAPNRITGVHEKAAVTWREVIFPATLF